MSNFPYTTFFLIIKLGPISCQKAQAWAETLATGTVSTVGWKEPNQYETLFKSTFKKIFFVDLVAKTSTGAI